MQTTTLSSNKSELVHVCHNLPFNPLNQENVPEFKKTRPLGPASFWHEGFSWQSLVSHIQSISGFIHTY